MSDRITPKRRAVLREALRESDTLRKDWKDSVQHHLLRVDAQFKELQRRLRSPPKGRQPKGLPSAKQAEEIRALIARVRVKADKGRAKDLRHVEEALRQALDKLPSE
jgi:hypothetical protein